MNRRRRRKIVTLRALLHDTMIVAAAMACLLFLTCAAVAPHATRGVMMDALHSFGLA